MFEGDCSTFSEHMNVLDYSSLPLDERILDTSRIDFALFMVMSPNYFDECYKYILIYLHVIYCSSGLRAKRMAPRHHQVVYSPLMATGIGTKFGVVPKNRIKKLVALCYPQKKFVVSSIRLMIHFISNSVCCCCLRGTSCLCHITFVQSPFVSVRWSLIRVWWLPASSEPSPLLYCTVQYCRMDQLNRGFHEISNNLVGELLASRNFSCLTYFRRGCQKPAGFCTCKGQFTQLGDFLEADWLSREWTNSLSVRSSRLASLCFCCIHLLAKSA